MIKEKPFRPVSGWLPLVFSIALLVGGPWYTALALHALRMGDGSGWAVVTGVLLILAGRRREPRGAGRAPAGRCAATSGCWSSPRPSRR